MAGVPGPGASTSSGKTSADPSAFWTCPYDPSHQVSVTGYLWHIHNCRLKFEGVANDGSGEKTQVCKFNAEHHFPVSQIKRHEVTCPDQYDMQRFVMASKTSSTKREKSQKSTDTRNLHADKQNTYEWESEDVPPETQKAESKEQETHEESDEESFIPLVYDLH